MKWILIIVGSLVGLIVLIVIIGAVLPRDHVASVTATIPAPPDTVWAALTDVSSYPAWRGDVERIEMVSRPPAPLSWREHTKQGVLTLIVEASEPPRRLVTRIADRDLPFGGTWEYSIAPETADSTQSRVMITERGFVTNPIFRFVSRFVMGHHSTLDTYLRALGSKFGSEVTPVRS
jgi:uncharacterized protein YndB with AHSA1/START domain